MKGTTCTLQSPWNQSEFSANSGIRQGAVESPCFFGAWMEWALQDIGDKHQWKKHPSTYPGLDITQVAFRAYPLQNPNDRSGHRWLCTLECLSFSTGTGSTTGHQLALVPMCSLVSGVEKTSSRTMGGLSQAWYEASAATGLQGHQGQVEHSMAIKVVGVSGSCCSRNGFRLAAKL